MSTDKGESDLDVFNDLKPHTPDGIPITDTKKTLMGIPVPDGGLANPQGGNTNVATPRGLGAAFSSAPPLPPVPGNGPATRSVPPPPPSQRPRRSGAPPPSAAVFAAW